MLQKKSRRAVTLTELLVVLAIVALLATLAVPVYISQLQRARIVTAQSEVRSIAEAEQQVAAIHGFYVPIHILDNVPDPRQGDPATGGARDDFETLSNASQRAVIDVFRPLVDQQTTQFTLASGNQRVEQMIETWQGPFLNPKRVRFVGENPASPGSGDITEDLVVDPWGNPYRFYTEFGITGTENAPNNVIDDVVLGMDNLRLNITGDESDRFDRYAIVSYGPDGITSFAGASGTTVASQGDDIFYEFSGISGNETVFRGF